MNRFFPHAELPLIPLPNSFNLVPECYNIWSNFPLH